jgi:PKHD-type hydroxylase
MLVHIPEVLSANEVSEGRRLLDEAAWADGRVTAGHQSAGAKDKLQVPEDHPSARQLGDVILAALQRSPLFIAAALPLRVFPPLFNRYQGGHVRPVTRGARVCSFFWIQSMIRDDGQRTLLFDLDTAIQRVSQDLPEHPVTVQLTGVYHNLLRRWAEM